MKYIKVTVPVCVLFFVVLPFRRRHRRGRGSPLLRRRRLRRVGEDNVVEYVSSSGLLSCKDLRTEKLQKCKNAENNFPSKSNKHCLLVLLGVHITVEICRTIVQDKNVHVWDGGWTHHCRTIIKGKCLSSGKKSAEDFSKVKISHFPLIKERTD